MKRIAFILAALVFSAPAHALLYCYDYDGSLGQGFEWINGQFTMAPYGSKGQQDLLDLGPPGIGPQTYCYANGTELAYIKANFIGLRMRTGKALSGNTTVYWVGDDAEFLLNNL